MVCSPVSEGESVLQIIYAFAITGVEYVPGYPTRYLNLMHEVCECSASLDLYPLHFSKSDP